MAERRMFSKKIIDSDAFMDMPLSTQALYLHLALRADDDGFVGNPKKLLRMIGANDDDFKLLLAKRFILPFPSGVCVIKHWLIHNYIQNDRYKETQYVDEKKMLITKDNKSYTECIQNVSSSETQVRLELGKVRLGEDSKSGASAPTQPREATPQESNRNFFSLGETYHLLFSDFAARGIDDALLTAEFQKFIVYWTEPNKSGTKVRWEQQSTFEVRRRLFSWLSRVQEKQKIKGKTIVGL